MLPLALLGLATLAALWLVLGVPWWRRRRRRRLLAQPVPAEWARWLEARWPLYRRLPPAVRERVHGLVQVFLAEKTFHGCRGLTVTDEVRVLIAAQACLLVAGRDRDCYPALTSLLVYPDEFVVPVEDIDDAGVHATGQETRSGESWGTGRVIVSWRDVRSGALGETGGYNVVFHEFAHQLDLEAGGVDGAPLHLDAGRARNWAAVFGREFEALRTAADRGEDTLIDPYGASSPGEFFAVATEVFFELPAELQAEHPQLYAELADWYGLDPAAWR